MESPKGHGADFLLATLAFFLQYFSVNPNPKPYCEVKQKFCENTIVAKKISHHDL